MSGAEATTILGVISSILTIVDATKTVYDAANDVSGLPEAFREVAGLLPIVRDILNSAKQSLDNGTADADSFKGAKQTVKACETKATRLEELFKKAIPKNGATSVNRYYKAVRAYGKGNEVEKLMKEMLEGLQLLACERGMKTLTKAQQDEIAKAIAEVSAIPSSVPEHEFQENTGLTANYSGSGAQTNYNAHGEYIAQGEARQNNYNSAGGPMHFEAPKENAYDACLEALFLTDPKDDRENLIQKKGQRADGTCEWIKNNDLYKSWLDSHQQLLWISGGPGKGKTMLSIFIAEELERIAERSDALVLQYFCDNNDEKRNTAIAILRSLVFQLLRSQRKLAEHILPTFKARGKSLFDSSSLPTLWNIFEKMVSDPVIGTTYCILDGLDESDPTSSEYLLEKLSALFPTKPRETSESYFNLIIVSRDFPDCIPRVVSSFPRIRLGSDTESDVNNDIRQFIDIKVDKLSRDRQYPRSLSEHVKDVFQRKAQGTFLWVGIVAKELETYLPSEVENALDLFPRGLDNLYARILHQIDVNRRNIVAKILLWVALALRPLTVTELAVATDTQSSEHFARDEVMKDIISYYRNLLIIKDNKIGLIHQSVKDYLLCKPQDFGQRLEFFHINEKKGNLKIAWKCLGYLQNGCLEDGAVDLSEKWSSPSPSLSRLEAFPLLSYAVLHWGNHARLGTSQGDNFDLRNAFFDKKSQIRRSWSATYWGAHDYYRDPPPPFGLAHIASHFGIIPLVERVISKQKWINKVNPFNALNEKDSDGMTPLHHASLDGHETVVRLLTKEGADVLAKDRANKTALHCAAIHGQESVVQLLLERGADIEGRSSSSPLTLAAEKDHEKVVLLLLERGANIEGQSSFGSPLALAAGEGHEKVVLLLLERGADIEGRSSSSPLILAAGEGHEKVVLLLLERGANIKDQSSFGSPLVLAAEKGHEKVVLLLLERGANIEGQHPSRNPLTSAASRGHEKVVLLLLERGADIEGRSSSSPLTLAAGEGHEKVVLLLLERGANIEDQSPFGSPLALAARMGHEKVVLLLLERGANIEGQYSSRNPLIFAALRGHEKVVLLLLEKGVDINGRDEREMTALDWATFENHKAVIQLLLKKGADVNAQDKFGRTALCVAAHLGHEKAVRLLLEYGADIDMVAKDDIEKEELHSAAVRGRGELAQLIVKRRHLQSDKYNYLKYNEI